MGQLPSGTVTFCFTDIEGSTQLFAKLGPRFLDLLEDHRRIIRAAVAEHGGAEVKTEGDGFFLAFGDPGSAVRASLSFQRGLAAHPWPDGGAIKVRVGIHMGIAEPREGDYMTYEVHQAARISAAGHGGQTIVSADVAALVDEALPDEASLRDLGFHELRDLDPIRLHQVCHPDLPEDFPPLRTVGGTRGYVPAPASTLIGRDDDTAKLLSELEGARLVTVTGSGGVGKTRIAVEVARKLLGSFADGVWFVDLAPVTADTRVDDAILDALGVVREGPAEPRDHLLSYLGDRTALLVIDNCEHLIEAASECVAAVLSGCPKVKVLATSREALDIAGEHAWRLRSLDTDTGITLFRERGCLVQPAFDPDADRSSVERIVERLDGIPLAIELAAARLRVLTPAQIADRLDDRFRLLTGGTRTALARQRTLEATVDWSYDLLDHDERALLRRLAVFVGGFDLEAAEAVWGGDVLDTLERLVDKSMVVASLHADTVRYRLLETVRHYGWTKLLDAGEVAAARDSHCEHYARLVEATADGLLDGRETEVAAKLTVELENIRSAVAWSQEEPTQARTLRFGARLWMYWAVSGRTDEGLAVLLPLVDDAPPDADRALLAEANLGAAHLLWIGSRSNEVMRSYARRALALIESDRPETPPWYEGWAWLLSSVTGTAEEHDTELLDRSIEVARAAGPRARFALAHALLAKAVDLRESLLLDDARAYLDQALEVTEAAGSTSTLAEVLDRKALFAAHHGDVDEAYMIANDAIVAGERGPNVYFRLFALFALNLVKTIRRDADAIAPAREIVAIANTVGLRYQEARAQIEIGWHELATGDIEAARKAFARCVDLTQGLGSDRPSVVFVAAMAAEGLAGCAMREARFDDARDRLDRNLQLAMAFGLHWPLALTRNALGWLEQEAGDVAETQHLAALACVRDVRTGPHALAALQARAGSVRGLAGVAWRRGEPESAARLFGAASAVREPGGGSRLGLLVAMEIERALRDELGAETFGAAWEEGVALGLDGAIELVAPSRR